ncbi:MAG TPA: RHS repeat-associated core domain-containing protein, partial [Gemmatales bacterium]|nr:RHS repeat-associated core domain-containing protein [Gemmatales bacterium]
TDALGHRTQWEYDLRNNLIRATDALGHVLTFIYDERNRQIARIDQRGILFTTGYDAFGRVTVRTDAACCGGESRQFVYDQPFNQPSRIIYANGAVEQYVYNGMGLLLRFTDANQLVTEFSYNSAGLPVSVRNPSGQLTWYTYDANGSMTSLTDSLNQRTEFQYDSLDRLVAVIDANQQSIRYEYDANNNRTAVIDRNGNRIAYAYDELNRLVQETWWSDSILDSDAYLQFEYDSLNRVIRSDDGDLHGKPRTILEYYYDAIGNRIATSDNYGTIVDALFTPSRKIQQLQWQGNGINPVRIEYAYDVADRVKIISRYPNLFTSLPASSSYFTRDAVGNLTELTHRNAADQVLSSYSYTYDAGRRLMSSFINGLETNYSYNAVGELLEADRSSGIDEHYSYDSNGNRVLSHLHAHYTTGTNNQLLTDGVYSYSYDQEGQLTTKTSLSTGEVVTYSYDHRHRLIEVTTRSASQVILSTVAYRYDALDRRIAQVTNGNTIFTAYNDMNVWADFAEAGNILSRYLTGNELDQMLARHQFATGMVWYLTDSLGSVREQISTGGLLRNRITYDSFGNVLSQTNPTFGDRFLFTGREYSAESKLYYYRARYYDPQIGRFISQDPILFKGGDVNLYRYVNNNPLSITDPTGMTAGAEYGSIQRLKALEAYYLRRQIINAKQASCLLRFVIGHLGDMAGVPSLPGQTYWEFLICMSQSWVVP